jgi:ribosome maturation factor RimP
MIEKNNIVGLADEFLQNTDKYVVDLQVKPRNIIAITIDGDTSVTIVDCIQLSKFIESKLDREIEDFDLKISSFGAEKPFKMIRQYRKNIGRDVEIIMEDDTIVKGNLLDIVDEKIKIKPAGKKKKNETLIEELWIDLAQIKQTKCTLSFK